MSKIYPYFECVGLSNCIPSSGIHSAWHVYCHILLNIAYLALIPSARLHITAIIRICVMILFCKDKIQYLWLLKYLQAVWKVINLINWEYYCPRHVTTSLRERYKGMEDQALLLQLKCIPAKNKKITHPPKKTQQTNHPKLENAKSMRENQKTYTRNRIVWSDEEYKIFCLRHTRGVCSPGVFCWQKQEGAGASGEQRCAGCLSPLFPVVCEERPSAGRVHFVASNP